LPPASLSLVLVFQAWMLNNMMISSFHLPIISWIFVSVSCSGLLYAGLALVHDAPPFWLHALPTAIFWIW
jgi:hypothetical protein